MTSPARIEDAGTAITPKLRAELEATPAGQYMLRGRVELIDRLMQQSPLKNEDAKAILCEAAVSLRGHMRLLLAKQQSGEITADESRAVASMAQALRRIMLDLQIHETVADAVPDFNY